MFAKLYTNENNQILVKIEGADGGPEVRFYFEPKDLGVCSFALSFDDSDEGWDKAEEFFEKIDEKMAIETVEKQTKMIMNFI